MCVYDAADALDLLFQSPKTMKDIQRKLDFPDSWDFSIAIREWVNISLALTFKCFVYYDNLSAISQYVYDCQFSEISGMEDQIKQDIIHFWQTRIKEAVQFKNYIFDVAAVEGSEKKQWILIDIKPFEEWTDSALFSWGKDSSILKSTKKTTIRFLHHIPCDKQKIVLWGWGDNIENVISTLKKKQKDPDTCCLS